MLAHLLKPPQPREIALLHRQLGGACEVHCGPRFHDSAEFEVLVAGRPERAVGQLRLAAAAGSAGDALFSWDSIADAPALRAALAAEAGATPRRATAEPGAAARGAAVETGHGD